MLLKKTRFMDENMLNPVNFDLMFIGENILNKGLTKVTFDVFHLNKVN